MKCPDCHGRLHQEDRRFWCEDCRTVFQMDEIVGRENRVLVEMLKGDSNVVLVGMTEGEWRRALAHKRQKRKRAHL